MKQSDVLSTTRTQQRPDFGDRRWTLSNHQVVHIFWKKLQGRNDGHALQEDIRLRGEEKMTPGRKRHEELLNLLCHGEILHIQHMHFTLKGPHQYTIAARVWCGNRLHSRRGTSKRNVSQLCVALLREHFSCAGRAAVDHNVSNVLRCDPPVLRYVGFSARDDTRPSGLVGLRGRRREEQVHTLNRRRQQLEECIDSLSVTGSCHNYRPPNVTTIKSLQKLCRHTKHSGKCKPHR
mmetsp:Transcript_54754/g.62944  ORF Transcript_54754/g.62944 Transcript_54754/m.62944 type:complete len:235 (-) Transcript_54754:308-1012(-)